MSGHIRSGREGVTRAPEFVRPSSADRQLGKTCRLALQGGEVAPNAARAVAKHPLPISPCREWFALFGLCKVDRVSNYGGLGKLVSVTVPVPSMLSPVKLT